TFWTVLCVLASVLIASLVGGLILVVEKLSTGPDHPVVDVIKRLLAVLPFVVVLVLVLLVAWSLLKNVARDIRELVSYLILPLLGLGIFAAVVANYTMFTATQALLAVLILLVLYLGIRLERHLVSLELRLLRINAVAEKWPDGTVVKLDDGSEHVFNGF